MGYRRTGRGGSRIRWDNFPDRCGSFIDADIISRNIFEDKELLNKETHTLERKYQFYVSDGADKFKQFANSIIKHDILSPTTIDIEDY